MHLLQSLHRMITVRDTAGGHPHSSQILTVPSYPAARLSLDHFVPRSVVSLVLKYRLQFCMEHKSYIFLQVTQKASLSNELVRIHDALITIIAQGY